jgi:hypothetical protein
MVEETPKTRELTDKDLDAAVGGAVPAAPGPVPIPYPNTSEPAPPAKRVGG